MAEVANIFQAFSADHVVRLTGLSKGQLRYWDRTGFFSPHYASQDRRDPYSRIYSFKDVVGLRTLAVLRIRHNVPLQKLRLVAAELSKYKDEPWADTKLWVLGKEVHFTEPETQKVRGVTSRQYVSVLLLQTIQNDVLADAGKLLNRRRAQIGHLERNRHVMHNASVIAGTRIPTKAIWRFHEAGYSTEMIQREYPLLTERDIKAALRHEKKAARRAA